MQHMGILRSLGVSLLAMYLFTAACLKKPDFVTHLGVSGNDNMLNKLTYTQVQLDFGVNLLGFHNKKRSLVLPISVYI